MSNQSPYRSSGSPESGPEPNRGNRPDTHLPDFDQMFSSLPDADSQSASPVQAAEQDDLQREIERMLTSIPPQGPLSTGALPRYATDAAAQRPAGAARRSTTQPAPTSEASQPQAGIFGEDESQIADFLTDVPAPRLSRPAYLRPVTRPIRESFEPARPAREVPHYSAINEDALGRRVLDELEKYSIYSVSQLRIAVHGGSVTIMGEVPSEYEKKLVVHFSKKVPGVEEVVDMMRTTGGPGLTAGPEVPGSKGPAARRAPPRNRKPSYTLQLPFRAWHVGVAAGLLISIWAGYSFATRDGSQLSVNSVTGQVLFDGSPPEGATVTLHPTDRSLTVRPRGFVGADGTFRLTTYLPNDGAPSGDYKLTVEWKKPVEIRGEMTPGPNLLPEALSKPESSRLSVTIKWGSNELAPVEISK
jgi:hypothetical protein